MSILRAGAIRRTVVVPALVLATIFGLSGVVAAPATATDATCTTNAHWTVTRFAPNTPWQPMPRSMTLTWGGYGALIGELDADCTGGTDSDVGIIRPGNPRIQVSYDRGDSWHTIYENHQIFWEGKGIIRRSGWFRIAYRGGTSSANDRWYGSKSSVVKVGVRRRATTSLANARDGAVATVRIAPATSIRGMSVRYQVKRAGKWRLYQRAHVSRRGVARAYFPPARLGDTYRVVLPHGRGMVRSVVGPKVVRRG
ncbi:hypothetical protein [Nocardioides pelophilus]|uniref:hypothetical protein n=1 Tax=Nocardioides pelophilus TaxID=2172019 RepID=UPI0016023568|nr:hypothetical protein [Nocardioides pelophilus]